ncbi:unnamed protein product [Cochlearia groenlandica]
MLHETWFRVLETALLDVSQSPRNRVVRCFISSSNLYKAHDEDIQSSKDDQEDPLQVPAGPMTRARAKKIKEALNGLIQELLDQENIHKSIGYDIHQVQPLLSMIQAQESPK